MIYEWYINHIGYFLGFILGFNLIVLCRVLWRLEHPKKPTVSAREIKRILKRER